MRQQHYAATAICAEGESLQESSDRAQAAWKKRCEEMSRFSLHGKEAGGELQRLQAEYARAYNRLERHAKNCAVCQLADLEANSGHTRVGGHSDEKQFSA